MTKSESAERWEELRNKMKTEAPYEVSLGIKTMLDPDAMASILDFRPKIDRVIFNDPATIVLWGDGTKTVVKAQNEPYDKEKGLAMAIAKKWFFNKGRYNNELKKWLEGICD